MGTRGTPAGLLMPDGFDWDRFEELYGKPTPTPTPDPTPLSAPSGPPSRGYAAAALAAETRAVAIAPEGTRNHTLNVAAFSLGQLVGAGALEENQVREALLSAARSAGLTEKEMAATFASGFSDGLLLPRTVPESNGHGPLPEVGTFDPGEAKAFWDATELLAHVHDYARARMAPPWAVLACLLARVVVATQQTVVLPPIVGTQASLNLFVALVAPSGGGKGISAGTATEAVHVDGVEVFSAGSGEGIGHLFARRTKEGVERTRSAVLLDIAEIDTLGALGARRGATLMPELRKAWSGERLGFAYADATRTLPLEAHSYRLCLITGVQPGRAGWVLEEADGGTPQRFLWVPATDPEAPDAPPACPRPIDWTKVALPRLDGLTGRYPMSVCAEAVTLVRATRREQLRGNTQALDGHALLTRLKVAAALALLHGRNAVDDEFWGLSGVLAGLSERTRLSVTDTLKRDATARNDARGEAEATRAVLVGEKTAEAAFTRVSRNVLRWLRERPEGDGMAQSEVRRKARLADRDLIQEALEALERTGQIRSQEARDGGRKWTAVE